MSTRRVWSVKRERTCPSRAACVGNEGFDDVIRAGGGLGSGKDLPIWRDRGFGMGSFSRGYIASIGGGAFVGFFLGGAPLAVLSLPSVWIGIGAMTGAVIGGIYGALWVRRDRMRR